MKAVRHGVPPFFVCRPVSEDRFLCVRTGGRNDLSPGQGRPMVAFSRISGSLARTTGGQVRFRCAPAEERREWEASVVYGEGLFLCSSGLPLSVCTCHPVRIQWQETALPLACAGMSESCHAEPSRSLFQSRSRTGEGFLGSSSEKGAESVFRGTDAHAAQGQTGTILRSGEYRILIAGGEEGSGQRQAGRSSLFRCSRVFGE